MTDSFGAGMPIRYPSLDMTLAEGKKTILPTIFLQLSMQSQILPMQH